MKQYLIVLNEELKNYMSSVMRGIEFLPIEGMNIEQNPGYKLLVVPPIEPPKDPINTEPAADV